MSEQEIKKDNTEVEAKEEKKEDQTKDAEKGIS